METLYLSEAHLILTTLTQYLRYAGNLRIADAYAGARRLRQLEVDAPIVRLHQLS